MEFGVKKPSLNPNKLLKQQQLERMLNGGTDGINIFDIGDGAVAALDWLSWKNWPYWSLDLDHGSRGASLKKNDGIVVTKTWTAYVLTIAVDFLVLVLPIIVFLTVLADWIYVNAIVLLVVLLLCVTCRRYQSSNSMEDSILLRTYISSYRVTVMLVTCICILAVDFRIFPRRYAKTETYGTSVEKGAAKVKTCFHVSAMIDYNLAKAKLLCPVDQMSSSPDLMDLGVGAYILANSLVSQQARGISRTSLKRALQSISPLLFLGFARLVSTAGVNYQVHVGEYGVHWNFFFTLAGVSILTSLVNVSPSYNGILGSLILVGYQVCLLHGLNVYLLSEERETDIISQNKEGIYSIFGYWGMYLVGVQLGNHLFFGNRSNTMRTHKSARVRVWILALLFWLITLFLDRHVERISRRTCNLAYVTNVLAVNLQMLGIIMLADFVPGSQISMLEEAFNRNLLATFLAANLMTGFVNLSVDTLFVSSVPALSILSIYACVLCCLVVFADFYDFKLKFW